MTLKVFCFLNHLSKWQEGVSQVKDDFFYRNCYYNALKFCNRDFFCDFCLFYQKSGCLLVIKPDGYWYVMQSQESRGHTYSGGKSGSAAGPSLWGVPSPEDAGLHWALPPPFHSSLSSADAITKFWGKQRD